MELKQLIDEFNAVAGLEQAPAAAGVWKFSADGHVFGVTADDAGEKVFLFGEVAAPPPGREEAFRKTVLEANFFGRGTGGAVFSINPETGAYTLVQSERLDRLAPEAFFALVERFVNALATWKGISDASHEKADSDAAGRPEVERPSFGSSGFMQV